jgi:predicted RNA-binding protein (virulence factor B family)
MASLTVPQEESLFSRESQGNSSSKGSRVTNEEWESVKTETEYIYIDQDHTLAATMETIQSKYGLVARSVHAIIHKLRSVRRINLLD